jgi:hypothetical protein
MTDDRILALSQRPSAWTWVRGLFCVMLLAGCSGGDNSSTSSSGPPTTPGAPATGPFNQGTGFNGQVVHKIVVAEDGSGDVFVGGDFTTYNGSTANRLIRLHPDGTVAQRFGEGFDEVVTGLALAKTGGGELYVKGGFTRFDGQPVLSLIRLTRTGTLDTGFRPAGDGYLIAPAEDGSGDLYAVFVEPDPTCVIEPFPNPQCFNRYQIARMNADGSLDLGFSTRNGFPGGSPSRANPVSIAALLPTSNGKLYVGGSLLSYNGANNVGSLVRLNMDGTLDSTFLANVGYLIGTNVVETIVPAGDGTQDIYVGGRIGGHNGMLLASGGIIGSIRLQETGALDSYRAPGQMSTSAIAPVQDGTGDVNVSGFAFQENRARLLRLNRTGAVVPTFREPNLDAEIYSIVPVQDGTGDFYIAGTLTRYNGVAVNHIARIHADGSLASVVN